MDSNRSAWRGGQSYNHLTSTKEITISNFKEVNDISFDGLYIGARLFIETVKEGSTINGNVYVRDTYLYKNEDWRCVGIRGRDNPLTIKGSIIFNATGAGKNINGTEYISRPIINIGGDWKSGQHQSQWILMKDAALDKDVFIAVSHTLD